MYKGSGSLVQIPNYRDVTLANKDSKDFGKQMRSHAHITLNSKAAPGMYGSGLNNGSTEITHLHVVAYLEYAQLQALTASA